MLYGVKPVIIAVVVQALWGLGKTGGEDVAARASVGGARARGEPRRRQRAARPRSRPAWSSRSARGVGRAARGELVAAAAARRAATSSDRRGDVVGLWPLFLVFLKIGSVLFGSGYVLLAFLRGDLVERLHWLTESQLLDAIAVGQVTPGPVFTTATFVGYVLGGAERRGGRDARHLPARVRVRRAQRPAGAADPRARRPRGPCSTASTSPRSR